MRIIQQMIDKKLENYGSLKKVNKDLLAYQEHLSAYMLCLAYLGLQDRKLKKKRLLFTSFSLTNDRKYLVALMGYKKQEDAVIIEAVKKMEKIKAQVNQRWSSLFDDMSWAILSYEHEMDE